MEDSARRLCYIFPKIVHIRYVGCAAPATRVTHAHRDIKGQNSGTAVA